MGVQPAPEGYLKHLVSASMTDKNSWHLLYGEGGLSCVGSVTGRLMSSELGWTQHLKKSKWVSWRALTMKLRCPRFLESPYNEVEMSVLLGTEQWSLNPGFVLFQGALRR